MTDHPTRLDRHWADYRQQIEAALGRYMDALPDCPPVLRDAMAYSLMAGGKRLRPVLVLMAAEACGGSAADALPAACAIEMIHTYSLIHDDLPAMDDDKLRRGRPTNHIVFGEANAILAGDGLLTLAFEAVARDLPAHCAAACCLDLALASGREGMVAGQVADLEAENSTDLTLEQLEGIHRRKTGRLLAAALTLGGRVAAADAETLNSLKRFGECIGLAFQIADDLLDVSGDPLKMGKGAQKDAVLGKLTYPALLGAEESQKRAKKLIDDAYTYVAFLGPSGDTLRALADFVLERDH